MVRSLMHDGQLDLKKHVSSLAWTTLQYLLYCIKVTCLAYVFCLHNVLWYTSRDLFYKMAAVEGRLTGLCAVLNRVQDYAYSLTTYAAFKVMASDLYSHATQRAFQGKIAPSTTIFTMDNKSRGVSELGRHNRPLVLNFGAVTCPIFAENLKIFNNLIKEFTGIADFFVVYTRESHASNEWRFENAAHSVKQHETIAERIYAARLLTEYYDVNIEHVVVDSITNETSLAYGAFPMRLFVLYNGQIHHEGSCGPMGYNMHDVHTVLRRFEPK